MKAARRKRRKAGFSPAFLLFISIILRIILSIAQKAKKRKELFFYIPLVSALRFIGDCHLYKPKLYCRVNIISPGTFL